MQWSPQKCAAQQEMMHVMSAKTLLPCLCGASGSVHLLTVLAGLSVCVCVWVSRCMCGWICHWLSQGNPVVLCCHQGNREDHSDLCVSASSMLVSMRHVFLNHSLEWILKFTVNSDSVENINLTTYIMTARKKKKYQCTCSHFLLTSPRPHRQEKSKKMFHSSHSYCEDLKYNVVTLFFDNLLQTFY